MKYSELISFSPIESTIQLKESNRTAAESARLVKTYVMSDAMAQNLQAPVIDQLQMDEVVDNKGVLVIGNYGTGKSHLMSVIAAVANDASNLEYLQNRKFAEAMKPIAGKFEILRIEIGGVTMSLREILFGFIQEDFDARGIDYDVPDFSSVRDNKKLIKDMMMAFNEKYPDKGYLIVVDEFLSYLTSRSNRKIVLDLEFMRALGEMCSKSNLRIMLGVQEKIFDNPKFSFVSDTLMHVRDRFTQISIKGEDTAFVVSERILKKTAEQKAMIRAHLEKFCSLYEGMSSKLDQFVDLFPIHPSYIDVFNKLYLIENRHILKNISLVIKDIFDKEVPANAPGIYSFDSYWPAIKADGLLKTDPAIGKVVDASSQLEEIINRAFPKPAYKPLAIKIIYALSVHRLQNNDLTLKFGMTAENLKDELCLYLPMPEQDADFLLGIISATLRDIMSTVSATTSAPRVIRRSCTSPAVSVSEMGTGTRRITRPVSMLWSRKNVVTPVSVSPLITAQLMGAAPRYCGRRAAWRLNVPRRGRFHTTSGSILNATTICKSGCKASRDARKVSSLSFSGCSTGMPFCWAYCLTGEACSVF